MCKIIFMPFLWIILYRELTCASMGAHLSVDVGACLTITLIVVFARCRRQIMMEDSPVSDMPAFLGYQATRHNTALTTSSAVAGEV
jgi:hypothetical protein